MSTPDRTTIRAALRAHEARHPLPDDPEAIHCLCGMWVDDYLQWTDHVSGIAADPQRFPEVGMSVEHWLGLHGRDLERDCHECVDPS